jgi:hypothetical protein
VWGISPGRAGQQNVSGDWIPIFPGAPRNHPIAVYRQLGGHRMNTSQRSIDQSMRDHFMRSDDNRPTMVFNAWGEKASQTVEKRPRLLLWY